MATIDTDTTVVVLGVLGVETVNGKIEDRIDIRHCATLLLETDVPTIGLVRANDPVDGITRHNTDAVRDPELVLDHGSAVGPGDDFDHSVFLLVVRQREFHCGFRSVGRGEERGPGPSGVPCQIGFYLRRERSPEE